MLFDRLRPLSRETKRILNIVEPCLLKDDFKRLKELVVKRKVVLSFKSPKTKLMDFSYPMVEAIGNDESVESFAELINKQLKFHFYEQAFKEFLKKKPFHILEDALGYDIVGLEEIKAAIVLSLVSKEPVHILLFGDPGTGKTKLIENVKRLASKCVFGLGSGISGVGLSLTVKGNEVIKGLLPLANEGVCCIDELNLMKENDRAALYSAMENGIVTYDKGNKHITLPAKITLFATANPGKGAILLKDKSVAKTQLPFDPALVSRFHLVFFIRKQSKEKFKEITKRLMNNSKAKFSENDFEFLREFVDYIKDVEIYFPEDVKEYVSKLSVKLKEEEENFFMPLTPRKIVGLVRLATAYAKLFDSKEVQKKHVDFAFNLIEKSLKEFIV
ncbi:MAG: replicative helicase Mcm [Candidatus Woesearchaeota archaeon]|nr:replicative helicase Mcm [Candidatus Woesearchaeota archaeon]